jgi:hypothetical protein
MLGDLQELLKSTLPDPLGPLLHEFRPYNFKFKFLKFHFIN